MTQCFEKIIIVLLFVLILMTFYNVYIVNSNASNTGEHYCNCGDNSNNVPIPVNPLPNEVQVQTQVNTQNVNDNKLKLFYATWCGYSKQFFPVWEQIKQHVSNNPELQTHCEQYDCDKDNNICSEYGIEGFPTVVLVKKDGSKIMYTGERSVSAVINFVKNNK